MRLEVVTDLNDLIPGFYRIPNLQFLFLDGGYLKGNLLARADLLASMDAKDVAIINFYKPAEGIFNGFDSIGDIEALRVTRLGQYLNLWEVED